jgi:hypothetical protein
MKKKLTARFAFFNVRVVVRLCMVLAGTLLALLSFDRFSVHAQQKYSHTTRSTDPLVPALFDCSKIHELGIDKQMNFRAGAIMIFCGEAQVASASSAGTFSRLGQQLLQPVRYGTTDVDLITGTETFPHITQSTTFTAGNSDNPLQIVVAYNDARGINASPSSGAGASVSTDGGNTFTRLTTASGQSPFPNSGSPVVLYNKPSQTWFTIWLDGDCPGLGGFKSTTPWDPDSWTHFCIHTGGSDDRESGWADNNPSSPFYGRMYVSWNDFSVGAAALSVTFSTDNGATWHSPVLVSNTGTFIRDVQITGDLATGDVYIAGMDEGGGGFPHNDTNYIFKSTDGGNTWTNTYTGPTFPGPGVGFVGYFAVMFADGGGYWRYEGWGEPAALNGVVHLVYAQHGTGSDPGDIYYIRSTDGGVTFGTPFKLNTDATTRAQWQPSLSAATDGSLFATWYDQRETDSCAKGNPAVPCYRIWGRKSTDNGVSWLPDMLVSDIVTPLPDQPDPGIVATYASDYDYGSSALDQHLHAWVDGRVTISGISQQDAFFDRELTSAKTPTPTPTATPTSTPTATPRATPTPRTIPTPRLRPTPHPRPTPR